MNIIFLILIIFVLCAIINQSSENFINNPYEDEDIKFKINVMRKSVGPREVLRHAYNTSSIYNVDQDKENINKLVNCCGCGTTTTKLCKQNYEICFRHSGYVYSNPVIKNIL